MTSQVIARRHACIDTGVMRVNDIPEEAGTGSPQRHQTDEADEPAKQPAPSLLRLPSTVPVIDGPFAETKG